MSSALRIILASVLIASGFILLTLIELAHPFIALFFLFASITLVFAGAMIGVDESD